MIKPAVLGFLLLVTVVLVSACSTQVTEREPITAVGSKGFDVVNVEVVNAAPETVSENLRSALHSALLLAVNKRDTPGGRPANLDVRVDDARMVSGTVRFFAGVFAGSNWLTVTATLRDPSTGASLGEFSVEREVNPGGYGGFRNPESGIARVVANEVAEKVFPRRI